MGPGVICGVGSGLGGVGAETDGVGAGITGLTEGEGVCVGEGGGGAAGVPVSEFDAAESPAEFTALRVIGYAVPLLSGVVPSDDNVVIRNGPDVWSGENARYVVPSVEYL